MEQMEQQRVQQNVPQENIVPLGQVVVLIVQLEHIQLVKDQVVVQTVEEENGVLQEVQVVVI